MPQISSFRAVLIAVFALMLPALCQAGTATPQYDPAALATIKADKRNCQNCNLQGADLRNTCVKNGDLTGANFDGANAYMMCMSYANFTNVTFRKTDLGGANLGHSNLTGADLTGADLTITSIRGTDLSTARGLTQSQVDEACGDADTKLPAGLKIHTCT
jgi:uncharacterized protein YjbI with pentapeptide repeats